MQIFTSSPIYRLQKTFEKLDLSTQKKFQNLKEFISSDDNYLNMRNALNEVRKNSLPCVPYIKIFLDDMTFLADGNVTKTDDGLIEAVIVKDVSILKFASLVGKYKAGTHLDNDKYKEAYMVIFFTDICFIFFILR